MENIKGIEHEVEISGPSSNHHLNTKPTGGLREPYEVEAPKRLGGIMKQLPNAEEVKKEVDKVAAGGEVQSIQPTMRGGGVS